MYIVGRKITRFYLKPRDANNTIILLQSVQLSTLFSILYCIFPSFSFILFSSFLLFFFFAMTHSYPIMMSHGSDLQPRYIRFTVISFVYFEDFQLLLKVASRFIPQEFLRSNSGRSTYVLKNNCLTRNRIFL